MTRTIVLVMAALIFAEGAWSGLGGSATGTGVSGTPGVTSLPGSVAVDPQGRPVVAWAEVAGGNFEIYVRRWNGSAWEQLGGSATGGGVSNTPGWSWEPVVAFDAQGEPVVAWNESLFLGISAEIMLRRWTGTAWQELGGSGSPGGVSASGATASGRPALGTDAAGNPIVAWTQAVTGGVNQIYLKRWSGSAWTELGGSATDGGLSSSPDTSASDMPVLATDAAGNPVVAWRTGAFLAGEIYLKRWNGSAWIELGGSAAGGGVTSSGTLCTAPSLALDAIGRPSLAWQRIVSGSWEICLRRWDGASWTQLGGSATGGGLSSTAQDSQSPSLAVSASGDPIVAWVESVTPQPEIWVRRWDGAAWSGVAGSGSGGGVSATATQSLAPRIAFDAAGGLTVAWSENVGGAPEVYVSQISLNRPTQLAQFQSDGVTPIPSGGGAAGGTVVLGGRVVSLGATETASLDVEVRPTGVPFTGVPTAQSAFVGSGATASVAVGGLPAGGHHWRARARTSLGLLSAWQEMGSDPDFVVGSASGGGGGGGGSDDKETRSCASAAGSGATLAALVLTIGSLAAIRRS